ncbi:hypothetical protein CDL12_10201 [Handroanthus impetiginosus]|uniref:Protein SHORTAGE IN CHIASMATA 1 n=1 Tax=Handroanthus impetiginosus TaxID=429701 RepID=A0A2G9HI84_9LAMI|nr:hypothetical protein CDL12_10201 [Handroanthus impetiginosus]
MRTRFLATDYSTAGGGGGFPLETLDFVRLPLPDLPPPNYPSFSADFLQTFDEIPIFGAFDEIEKLPIDDALSMFLSDVLPHFVDGVGYEESRVDGCEEKSEVIPSEEKGGTAPNNKGGKFVQFEIPEMDISMLSLKCAVHSQIECSHIFSEIPDAEFTMDLLDSELMLHDHSQIQQSIYSVDEMSIEHTMEQEDHMLEDADSVQGELHPENINFPLFEVDVESPGVLGRTYLMDELLSFENIGEQQVAQPDEVNRNNKELLGTMEFDLIKYLLHHSLAIQSLEDTNFSSEMDHLSIIELPLHQKYSTLHNVNSDGYSIWTTDPILFDEFLFLDLDPYQFSEVFSDSAKEIEAETCESMFGEAMKFRSFSQLIVCHELTLMDDSFKSLPVPIISDCGNTSSLHSLVEELLSQLDWQSSSATDGLYLDWHFLGEDGSVSAKYSSCWKIVSGIDTYHIDAAMSSSDSGKLIFDFILSEAHSSEQNAENCKEILNLSSNDVSIIRSSGKADLSSLSNHLSGKRLNEDILLKTGVEKVPVFGESMSSDLDFFLNPRNYITQRESIPADKSIDTNSVGQVLMSCDDSAPANATTEFHQKWNIKIHQVQLSDNILLLLDNLWNNFLVMLENDKELIQLRNQFQASNDFTLLHIPNEKLKLSLQEKIASSKYLTNNDEDIMSFAMLCAIKQMAFYLCYYGIQSTYLYMDKLSTSLQWFKSRLSFLYNLIRDENQNAEKEPSITHPSISIVQGILQTQSSSGSSKILIVSDQVFWSPLKRLLTSLKISYNEPKHLLTSLCQQQHSCDIPDSIMDIMLNSDCCLVSFDIAASTLTSLSFAFSCCILIFEGECNFLCNIMESSDELYAAAASLGIDIQLFFSYSSSMTEEIILSCISVAAKLSRSLYPKMSDSESLAESFLTAFPSINPLSAHAILSSDAILGKFLESSNGGRICSLQKYQVPDESIALLSAISRYGEREDSKSGMTDCSSSVSIPDSENVQLKSVSERKKSKYRHEPYDAGRAPNDLFCTESLELLPNDQLNLPKLSVSCNSWLSGDTEISNKSKQFSLSFNDKLLGHSQKIDADMMKKSIDRSSLYNFPLADALQISDETEKPCMTQIDIDCSPRWRSGTATKNHFSRQSVKVTGAPQENFAGEVLDVEDTPAFRENFSAVNSSGFSPSLLDVEKDYAARNSRMGKRPFSATTLAMSTNPTDINSGSGGWVSRNNKRQILREEIRPHFDTINRANERVEEDILEQAPQNSNTLTFQKKGLQNFGRTPLSSALHSTHMQQGSPWTMEFLNRIREKSRLRKQSVSYDLSSPCFVSPGNTSKVTKRKSPSILELYKYRGGGTPQRTVEQKGLKRSSQPLNSVKNKKASASCPSSLTPVDKRARGTLSFSSNGGGGQSKLVWRDNNYHAAQRRL